MAMPLHICNDIIIRAVSGRVMYGLTRDAVCTLPIADSNRFIRINLNPFAVSINTVVFPIYFLLV